MAKTVSRRKKKNPISRYIGETVAELKKVTWPTRKDATQLTIIVLIVVGLTSVLLGSLDILFTRIFAIFINLG